MIFLKDNSKISDEYKKNKIVKELLNRNLLDLQEEGFIIFPANIQDSEDLENDSYLFKEWNRQIWTGNLVGFFSKGSEKFQINSRFYDLKGSSEDFFITYLLQRVLSMNITKSTVESSHEFGYYDLLAFLFPVYLNSALQKGIYKEYICKQYNDLNIKGSISVSQHIQKNTPFMGKFAYSKRDFSYDNKVTQLIRHTIEKLQYQFDFQFFENVEFKENVKKIIESTPKYHQNERSKVIDENIVTPVKHGYFEEYSMLQSLCIKILNAEQIGLNDESSNVVNGIIIDVAWLWETYLATLLVPQYVHSENKTGRNPIYFYTNNKNPRYPDFYSEKLILDAKYKRLDKYVRGGISREDLYQITSYLHVQKAKAAGLIFPTCNKMHCQQIGELSGYGGRIFKIGFEIPQKHLNYDLFVEKMRCSELMLLEYLAREESAE